MVTYIISRMLMIKKMLNTNSDLIIQLQIELEFALFS